VEAPPKEPARESWPQAEGASGKEKDEKPTLVVFNFVPEKGVEKGIANMLTELVLDSVAKSKSFSVIGQKDLEKMVAWEKEKMKACTEGSCLAEIAGAMGAAYYIEGSIGVLGDEYVIALKYMDAKNVTVIERDTKRVKREERVLADTVSGMVAGILGIEGGTPAKKRETPVTEPSVKVGIEVKDGGRVEKMVGYSCGGAAVLALGGGLYFGLKSKEINDGLADNAYPAGDVKSKVDEGNTAQTMQTVGYVAAGVLAVASGYFLYTGYTAPAVGVAVSGEGVMVGIGGRY
jgi:TolB-like protein